MCYIQSSLRRDFQDEKEIYKITKKKNTKNSVEQKYQTFNDRWIFRAVLDVVFACDVRSKDPNENNTQWRWSPYG